MTITQMREVITLISVLIMMLSSASLEIILQVFPQLRPTVTLILSQLVEIVGKTF